MSERTIKRSVFHSVAAMLGIATLLSFRNEAAFDTDKKGRKFRNNWTQRVDAKVKKVRRWRKRNRIASASRARH